MPPKRDLLLLRGLCFVLLEMVNGISLGRGVVWFFFKKAGCGWYG